MAVEALSPSSWTTPSLEQTRSASGGSEVGVLMDIWKLSGIGIYLVILIVIGVVAARRMKNLSDYYAAGKSLGFFSGIFSPCHGRICMALVGVSQGWALRLVKAFWVVLGEVLGVMGAWLLAVEKIQTPHR